MNTSFLPVSREDMIERGWYWYDFLLVTGDAYVDHPSFGAAVIGRVLENAGYRVAILAQPDWRSFEPFAAMGKPKLAAMVTAGNLDSMVSHYTAAKKPRSEDYYSPGKKAGLRPDRASIAYSNRIREAFPGLPLILGGLEASLRRFAHYDYWDDKVRASILVDADADFLVYGMGETATLEIAERLKLGVPVSGITDVRGVAYVTSGSEFKVEHFDFTACASYDDVRRDKKAYAKAAMKQYLEHDPIVGKAVAQRHGERWVVVNPPALPLSTNLLDKYAELPYTRKWHPSYDSDGGVPALEEVRFSVIHNRGCFGACNFCALAFHQGRIVTSRSLESVVREVTEFTKSPLFKGYVHDVGGPTANFRAPSCKAQLKRGMCKDRACLSPTACPNVNADHSDYLTLLRKIRAIPGVKKVFIRSGVRFDYLMLDKSGEFFAELVKHHVSGQLKVAPEHCVDGVLSYMGKPENSVYERFVEKWRNLNERYGKKQFLVPYLMSSHPGCTMDDARKLSDYLRKRN
ncbi:MAG: YgiQ family radical SAM protein, partial [Oscillospiraceae bacterium]|nr:YgiQ family radical SAM protein [Oscillospiraceae bacterium]